MVGVFDSGLGGLTVVREIKKVHPKVRIVYLGDTARVPYGTRSRDTIVKFSLEGVKFLAGKGIDSLVVACNTASAFAYTEIKKSVQIPVYEMISWGVKGAAGGHRIGVLATQATIRSGAYGRGINKEYPGAEVKEIAAPLLVPLVEAGETQGEIVRLTVRKYLENFTGWEMDTLILGCTHYPWLWKILEEETGPKVKLVNPGEILAENLEIEEEESDENQDVYCLTDVTESFLNKGIEGKIQKVEL